MKHRVVVTGLGTVSPVGLNVRSTWQSLLAGRSGVDYITTFDHPVLGPVKMVNHPVTYSETPAGIWREAPELGQHTEEILIDELGYSWDDIQRLKTAGAIL